MSMSVINRQPHDREPIQTDRQTDKGGRVRDRERE